jgi:hypothetical protein
VLAAYASIAFCADRADLRIVGQPMRNLGAV